MKSFLTLVLLLISLRLPAQDAREMLIIVSEPGGAEYEAEFHRQATVWQDLAKKSGLAVKTIGLEGNPSLGDREQLEKHLMTIPHAGDDFWLVWIGHGSFDGRTANFNLRGKDIDAVAVKELLKPFTRRLMILNLFSASANFLPPLAGENRIIVSSTRSGGERNYSRFGEGFAEALSDPLADFDLDGSLSLLEATLYASNWTRAFYENAQRVLQEHAVIDDNGDGQATSTEAFQGLRAETKTEGTIPPDGALAREVYFSSSSPEPLSPEAKEKRANLELKIEALRKEKPYYEEDEYYHQLESLMREMAKFFHPNQ